VGLHGIHLCHECDLCHLCDLWTKPESFDDFGSGEKSNPWCVGGSFWSPRDVPEGDFGLPILDFGLDFIGGRPGNWGSTCLKGGKRNVRPRSTLPEFVAQQDSSADVGLLKELGRVNFNRLLRREKKNFVRGAKTLRGGRVSGLDEGQLTDRTTSPVGKKR
jgi:hypothetical protein